ncbi:GNAT family N-acetyltransferase [Adhaeribacter soli]|uniref:GNAT family N-acetyltransferase n=1 Tax=Adhaeribacter soli TaxID=2607655 RepID=A0A5N1J5Y4_9BACT|nr:GNAT family protein [Adhaeribacter soli]KAA9346100.1 GNAT family N-acetyltransferase [Adhaeribacter soli]
MAFIFSQNLILENERAKLSLLGLSHLERLIPAATADKKLTRYSPFSIATPDDLKHFIQNSLIDRRNQVRYAFAIYDKQFQEFAGSTSFGTISNKDQRLEIGWTWLGPKFQKTGLNINCKYLLLQYVFEELKFERVEFRTDERNTKSREAIEKIGGTLEGILRSHTLMLDGFRRSSVYYSILKEEWPEVKKGLEVRLAKGKMVEV